MQTAYSKQYYRNKLNDFRRLMIMHMIAELATDGQSMTVRCLHMLFNEVMKRDYGAEPMGWQNFHYMWVRNCEGAWHSDISEEQGGIAQLTEYGRFRLASMDMGQKIVEFVILIGCQSGKIQRERRDGSLVTVYKWAA